VFLFFQLLPFPEMVDFCPGDALDWACHPLLTNTRTTRLIQWCQRPQHWNSRRLLHPALFGSLLFSLELTSTSL
jgi:hypothetical protein